MQQMDETIYEVTNCDLCCEPILAAKDGVKCSICSSHYHESCAKLNDNMQTWSCATCAKNQKSSTLQVPKTPKSTTRSKQFSKGASSSTTSSKAKALLESLEEEKKILKRQSEEKERLLREAHEQELQLLKKKQVALQEIASSKSGSSRRSVLNVPKIDSEDKVEAWIQENGGEENVPGRMQDSGMQTDPVSAIRFTNPVAQSLTQLQASIAMPVPLMHSTFNVSKEKTSKSNTVGVSSSMKHNLSREEIAARHVIKELPKFDGNPKAWPRFITSFNRSTDVCGFNDLENLERLSASLLGKAFSAVESSLTMEENVPRILETLEMLFGKPEFIITSLLEEMRKSSLPSAEDIDSIIRYSLEVENISSTMKIAKLSEHLWNPILLSEMTERLPSQLKLEWATYKYSNPALNIESFSAWLKNKATAYSTVLVKPPNLQSSSEKQKSRHSINIHQETTDRKCVTCHKQCKKVEVCETFRGLCLADKWIAVRKHELCRICLTNHKSKICSKDDLCGIEGCQFRHHRLLHKHKSQEGQEEQQVVNLHHNEAKAYFKILPICLRNGPQSITVYAMLDDGSSLTLMDSRVAKHLNLSGVNKPLCLRWTGDVERRDSDSEIVNLHASSSSNSKQSYLLSDVRTVDNLNLPSQSVNMEELTRKYDHLRGVPISSFENIQPSILIGLNHSKLMEVTKYRFGRDGEPAAAKTVFGWCIFGAKSADSVEVFHINHCDCSENLDSKLEDMVRENYSLESIGVSNQSSTPRSNDDLRAFKILEDTTKFNGRHFEVGLLWRYDSITLPDNFSMAVRRQRCLERRFQNEPELLEIINNHIRDYVDKGYARRLPKNEVDGKSWFLPIFIVRNPNKPNKVRLVWDAAAEIAGVSLNKVLLKGPDLLASLPGVLLRFREHKIALTGDIKEMFHQVEIRVEDRRFQRFLWRSSIDADFDVYEMNVMTFGATCSPSCSQFIKNRNAERFKEKYTRAVQAIQQNHYVDDWLESVDCSEEAIKLAKEVKDIHSEGGFEIRNWISNDSTVVQHLNETSSCGIKNMEICPKIEADKILGMFWRTSDDAFTYILKVRDSNVAVFKGDKIPTKREVLRILMSVFDPLGLIANVLIFPKILLQRIWRSKTNWDDEILQEHHLQWMLWAEALERLTELRIPRWIGLFSAGSKIEMHSFVDASEDAYAAVIYFKVSSPNGPVCSLITAKSRVAPLQGLSVPRLELQAAVLGVRLANFIEQNISEQHQICKRYFWTDSETVMKWLHSDNRRYSQFVGCRVGEIMENSKVQEWNWIAGNQNIADLATKMRIQEVCDSSEWFHGPMFLQTEVYPVKMLDCQDTEEELRPQHQIHHVNYHEEAEHRIEKWTRLRRTYAYVFRFLRNLRLSHSTEAIISGPISSCEYIQAENYLFKKAQSEDYADEYSEIEKGNPLRNKRSVIYKDSPFMDDHGVLRSKSRIQSTPYASFNTKNPILLPKDHRITSMILQFYHEKYHHQFVATVANEVKQKFIIPRLKVKLNSIRRECQACKNRDAKPDVPEESELPPARITPFTLPFTFTGIDYFGPIQVAVGRKREKRWCMLVTCLTTRAVHLEVAHALSTDSCIMGLRRFISRRGKPREIFTDNGTNFRGAKNELRAIWDHIDKQKLAETFIDCETKWMFIPPASPHMGGAWERMVRSVKRALQVAIPFRVPNDEMLLTMLAEVENIINNRPLTYVAVEHESEEALTPNHLLLGSTSGVKPVGDFQDDSSSLRASWHKAQLFANNFWKRWVKEYLPTLSRRTKWFTPNEKELQVGDIVILLCEDKTGSWPKGKVLEIFRGRDRQVRSASIQLSTGIYVRPVSKLAILDVHAVDKDGTLESHTRIPGGTVTTNANPNESTSTPCTLPASQNQTHNENIEVNERSNQTREENNTSSQVNCFSG